MATTSADQMRMLNPQNEPNQKKPDKTKIKNRWAPQARGMGDRETFEEIIGEEKTRKRLARRKTDSQASFMRLSGRINALNDRHLRVGVKEMHLGHIENQIHILADFRTIMSPDPGNHRMGT